MPRITLIKLLEYREWTESLGDDREWIIQLNQSKTYTLLQSLFSKKNGYIIPLRYDYYLALSNGIGEETHREVLLELESIAPRGAKMVSIPHKYPFTAQLLASRIMEKSPEKLVYIHGEEDETVVAHIDFDDITALTYKTSIYESYLRIQQVYTEITFLSARLGGITSYLGGDNILVILPKETINDFIDNMPSYLKIGVGIAKEPRKALSLATKALDMLRRNREKKKLILHDESEVL